jgi:hypothetical protein
VPCTLRLGLAPLLALAILGASLAGCLERPLDGEAVSTRDNPVHGYVLGPGWQVRLVARDARTGRDTPLPLYRLDGRATTALVSSSTPSPEARALSPDNPRDDLYAFDGLYDLPPWALEDGRARLTPEGRPPGTTAWTEGFTYTKAAYHGCLLAGAEAASTLFELGARCSTGRSLTVVRAEAP